MIFNWVAKQLKQQETYISAIGEDTLSIRAELHWFNRFKNGGFYFNNSCHYGRPLEVDIDVLKQCIEEDPRLATHCSVEQPRYSHTRAESHFKKIGKMWKHHVCVPHEL